MTLREAAAYAGLTPVALRAAINAGTLAATKMGRDWFVTASAVDQHLATRRGGVGRKPYTRRPAAPHTPEDA